ncbi:hypothetical protein PENFLA_c044G07835 [Penicillium flavigenum]|uniref:Uncharacterized protein n=1 Tax=Penicillium flavigenum TaxID=254877 RepID=A0A1V6SI48_9EURO|nr:hypothetical protein PENFLA_c044G07835 [Penicillium flavigenum]
MPTFTYTLTNNIVVTRNRHGKWPIGEPVIVWAHGLSFIPVFAEYYALAGSHLRKYMWLLTKKMSHTKIKHHGWHPGEMVVSPKKLRTPTDTATTFNVDFDTHDWSKFSPVPVSD